MNIEFIDETNLIDESYIKLIQDLIIFAAKEEGVSPDAEMSISFVNNDTIQELNRNYRGIDKPTDVISFALQDSVEGEIEIKGDQLPPLNLGDIVISVDKAEEQAEEYEHSLEREYGFLALHGFLHLLGYDHIEYDQEQEMFKKQEDILNAFGLPRK
ncbi:rRNA maturation RNase YbeY [Amphibacillus xylanus]|uniref:Endoribonuclease YbeY n=1 Tax=Amphibacillus xylanus (strain ATCC 51415 / DSM 6626 / JCM 7361 / LMG 17667 / NBRC 15112 / Ep01) TaxID=698758 RepID=K0IXN5_AMPXN|nr:rRNA maturation RNase YbeY [Amphibacillus xylanus]BAM47245.1 putative metalloprotease [Amphibacillus xylanus NBRC 15112]